MERYCFIMGVDLGGLIDLLGVDQYNESARSSRNAVKQIRFIFSLRLRDKARFLISTIYKIASHELLQSAMAGVVGLKKIFSC